MGVFGGRHSRQRLVQHQGARLVLGEAEEFIPLYARLLWRVALGWIRSGQMGAENHETIPDLTWHFPRKGTDPASAGFCMWPDESY